MQEVTQDDLFTAHKQALKKAELQVKSSKDIPLGYVPVTFASNDVLCPAILHFRNYTLNELLELTSATEENQFEVLVTKVLNNMIFEEFDCSKLHIEHIKQILLTIYKNFWNNTLFSKPYYIDLNGNDDDSNIAYTDVNINELNIIQINPKFKNKFKIVDTVSGKTVSFILPIVEHLFIASKYVKNLFAQDERKFSNVKSLLALYDKLKDVDIEKANSLNIDINEKNEFHAFEKEKSKAYFRALQAQLIYSVNNVELQTIEEKIQAYSQDIDALTWKKYTETVEKFATFGVDSNYTFSVDGKTITRRFSFRPMGLIPSMESQTDTRYVVQFDD